MDSQDLFLTILIFFIFIFLYIFNVFYIKYKEIKRNWDKYKCQPMVMPFASFFGHDVADNFVSCIGNIQGGLMDEFLKPILGDLSKLSSVSDGMSGDIGLTAGLGNSLGLSQLSQMGSFMNITGVIAASMESMLNGFTSITKNLVSIGDIVAQAGITFATLPKELNDLT